MNNQKARLLILLSGGLFLLLDQILKWVALNFWTTNYLPLPFAGWQPFFNRGIAFGLPLANSITIIISLLLIAGMVYFAAGTSQKGNDTAFLGWTFVVAGAVSNLIDRLARGGVVDYLFLLTGYINIGDIAIAAGLLILFLSLKKNK